LLPLVRFNLRVYGLWVNSRNELLVSEEYLSRARGNAIIFKFPGGGVQLGEGLAEALRREWHEELGLPINQLAHYYTTDFFQRSAFDPREQIVSVYYKVQSPEGQPLVKHDETDDAIAYHWWPLHSLEPERLSLPIDQHVARLLLNERAR
jgi:ADP-ribose pyrophosphatase YjhB (NUDIX family)